MPTADPFELILWENVAYLAPLARRREAFELLRRTVGTAPAAILAARQPALEEVTARGILKGTFAAKLRECARIALEHFRGDLEAVVREPPERAARALRQFPGIGAPGAEKILLFAGRQSLLAADSNALRVLARLGLIAEDKSYARMYRASRELAKKLVVEPRVMQEAHLLLEQHGKTLCKRAVPRCEACPLAARCAYAANRGKSAKRARGAKPGLKTAARRARAARTHR
ncbi:MAG: hypothetical protein ACREVV_02660 [Steroidobacteraceae bacterium]